MNKTKQNRSGSLSIEFLFSQLPKLSLLVFSLSTIITVMVMALEKPVFESNTRVTQYVAHPYLESWQVESELKEAIDNPKNFAAWRETHSDAIIEYDVFARMENIGGTNFVKNNNSLNFYRINRGNIIINNNDLELIANFLSYVRFVETLKTEEYKQHAQSIINYNFQKTYMNLETLTANSHAVKYAKLYLTALAENEGYLIYGATSFPEKISPQLISTIIISTLFSLLFTFTYFLYSSTNKID